MKPFYQFLLAMITVMALGFTSLQAQVDLRTREDDGGRPEEDNISGSRDDPSQAQIFFTQQDQEGTNGGGAGESDGDSQSNPSRFSTGAVVPALSAEVFPNPASDYLQINLGVETEVTLTMHNLVGREVYRFNGKFKSHRISLDSFNPGVYFISAYTDAERIVRKVRVTP